MLQKAKLIFNRRSKDSAGRRQYKTNYVFVIEVQSVLHKGMDKIRKSGYGVTTIDVYDTYDNKEKKLLLMEVKNKNIKELTNLIKKIDEKAFITLRETQTIYNGFVK